MKCSGIRRRHTAGKELIAFLQEKYTSIDALNQVWGTGFGGFEELEKPIADCSARYPARKRISVNFQEG